MGKRRGRLRDSAFASLSDREFALEVYDDRHRLAAADRARVEREAKARGLRNRRKQR